MKLFVLSLFLAIGIISGNSEPDPDSLRDLVNELRQELLVLRENHKLQGDSVEERLEKLEQLAKVKVLRTCEELAHHGVTKSDYYDIDPDGDNIGQPPIQVYCDFQTGETLVEHNAMDMVVVPHDCDAEGCFVLDVKYSAPNDQIQALIQLSQSCSQSIDFGCFLAPLSLEGTDYGWWRDKNGAKQTFFAGNHIGEHICSCGESDSCFSTEWRADWSCNCDAKVPAWLNDFGEITAKEILPISGFNYGPLQFDAENANVTIGPLKCSGSIEPDSSEVTCNSLKRGGETRSSLQLLKDGDYPRISYCAMEENSGYVEEMETPVTYVDVNSLPGGVHFSVEVPKGTLNIAPGQSIAPFENVYLNIGNGFDGQSGKFTTPISGVYRLIFSFTGEGRSEDLAVLLNGSQYTLFEQANNDGADDDFATIIWSMELKKGDVVNLQVHGGTMDSRYSGLKFIGDLVSEL